MLIIRILGTGNINLHAFKATKEKLIMLVLLQN